MSERWPRFGSKQPSIESDASGSSSANGADPEDAESAPRESAEEPVVRRGESADETTVAAKLADDASVSATADDASANPAEPMDPDDEAAAAAADDPAAAATLDEGSLFLAELVRAMRATAGLERVKIGEDTDRRRQDHIDGVRAREASEADRLRELAGEDMKTIEAWADGETKRIQLERERRENVLNQDLETSLAGHRAKIDREIDRVETAIATYRAEVDAFFESLDHETDPVLIAQQAAMRPVFPELKEAETTGRSEHALVGIMDAEALAARIGSWPNASLTHAGGTLGARSDDVDTSSESSEAEPIAATTGSSHGSADELLEAVPVSRPMSWLRRGANGGDDDRLNRQD